MKMKFADAKEILTLETEENEKLLSRADEINTTIDGNLQREITTALKKTIEKNGITALSANAIGYDKRIFCIKFDNEIKTFINPVIIKAEGLQLSREKCTSLPDREFIAIRNTDITVMYQRPMGKIETRQLVGLSAFVFQHELQHLDGVLLSDFALEIDEDWDKATDEEREEVINYYLDSLDIRAKELDKEIQEDPELKKVSDAIDFITSVYKGETKLA